LYFAICALIVGQKACIIFCCNFIYSSIAALMVGISVAFSTILCSVFLSLCVHIDGMSGNPEGRTIDSKEASKSNIEESPPEPIAKPDPTEPVSFSGGAGGSKGEAKGTTI
jgi:hypothetical protein